MDEPLRSVAPHPGTSILLSRGDYLTTLRGQHYHDAELLTWDDDAWHEAASRLAGDKGWSHRRVESRFAARMGSTGRYAIEWNVYQASDDALRSLVSSLAANPENRGAMAANFDPAILWWSDELIGPAGRDGLAQSDARALDAGPSSN